MTESTRLHAALANLARFGPEYQCIVAELAKTIVARSGVTGRFKCHHQ